MAKLRVGVIMGGKTIEKEVSFNSGRTVCDHLDTSRYEIIPIFITQEGTLYQLPWHFLHRGKTTDFEHRLPKEAVSLTWDSLKTTIDFAYIATHGRYAEDGTLQGFLEVLRIPYLGSKVFASALGMDKLMQKDFLSSNGIKVPACLAVYPHELCNKTTTITTIVKQLQEKKISFPVIVKPHNEGSSLGITVVHDKEQLYDALCTASKIHPLKEQPVLIEEKIEGMEFSCIIITDYKTGQLLPLPPTEIVPDQEAKLYDYEQKYMPGKATKFTPPRKSAQLIKKIQDTCLHAMQVLGFTNIGRIDGFLTSHNEVYIIDPNSLSGMSPTSFLFREAAEIDMGHTQLINHLIETELESYGMLTTIIAQEKEAKQMHTQKIRVAILMGGASNEKEISLESGRNITYKLSPQKYEAVPLFINSSMELYRLNQSQLVRASTKEIAQLLDPQDKINWHDLPAIADFVFLGLHGGEGENGSVQGALELLGLPYNGSSVLASALCMDKFKTTQFLRSKGFDVPHSLLIEKNSWQTQQTDCIATITKQLSFPIIVKPHDDGCSVLVQKAKNQEALITAINTLFASDKQYAMVEECIAGMELTVGVIGNDKPIALPPSQAVSASEILSIEEKFLPGAGENQTPAPLPKATLKLVQDTIAQAYKALGCKGYSRIDCFYQTAQQSPSGKERVIILENNSLPGMTPATCIFHQAAEIGIRPMDFIDLIIQLGFEEHKKIPVTSPLFAQEKTEIQGLL